MSSEQNTDASLTIVAVQSKAKKPHYLRMMAYDTSKLKLMAVSR